MGAGTHPALDVVCFGETLVVAFACEVGARVVERLGAVEGLPRAEALAAVMPVRPPPASP